MGVDDGEGGGELGVRLVVKAQVDDFPYLVAEWWCCSPTPRPTARPTIRARSTTPISRNLFHPPRFDTCLLFLKSENFSPLGPVTTSLYTVYGGGSLGALLPKGKCSSLAILRCGMGGASGCISPSSSISPSVDPFAARRGDLDGVLTGELPLPTIGPTPPELFEYADGESMMAAAVDSKRSCDQMLPERVI